MDVLTLYALKTDRSPTPERAAMGAPKTGWVHEAKPPWRVMSFSDLASAKAFSGEDRIPAVYDGNEDTVPWQDLLPDRSNRLMSMDPDVRRAEASRVHYVDAEGVRRCPDERPIPDPYGDGITVPIYCPHFLDPLRYRAT